MRKRGISTKRQYAVVNKLLHELPYKFSTTLKIYHEVIKLHKKKKFGCKKIYKYLAQTYGKIAPTTTTIYRWVNGTTKPMGYYNTTLYEGGDLAYALGALLGDGSTAKRQKRNCHYIVLTALEREFVKEFSNRLAKAIGRKPAKPKFDKKHNYYVVRYSHLILYYLVKAVRKGRLSLITPLVKKYPVDFLRGIYDAEGSVSKDLKNHRIDLGIKDRKVARLLVELLKTNGFNPRFYKTRYKTKNTGHSYIYRIILSDLEDLMNFADKIGFSIIEKRRKLRRLIKLLWPIP